MKKIKIAQVAPLWFSVPPKKYGGTERVVADLCDGLVDRGHKVTLFAAPGSKTKAKLISVSEKPLLEAGKSWNNPIWNLKNISQVFQMARKKHFDIVHFHLDFWPLLFENLCLSPTIHTIHNDLSLKKNHRGIGYDRLEIFKENIGRANFVFVSNAALRQAGLDNVSKKNRVIYNCADLNKFKFNNRPQDKYIWIGRINKYKGAENAIKVAKKLKIRLELAGPIDFRHQSYFDKKIKPHLNSEIKYLGELAKDELSDFYGSAKAFIYPIEWSEPFGLVVAEAMACGTPVIAYKRGSMTELIDNGNTGFVVKGDLRELAKAIRKIDTIDRKNVRNWVEKMFSKDTMVSAYEKAYEEIIESSVNNVYAQFNNEKIFLRREK